MILVASHESPEVLEPADRTLYLPASPVASELSPILSWRLGSIRSMWANQLDAVSPKPSTQRIAIGRGIVDQAKRLSAKHPLVEQGLNQRYLVRIGAGDVDPERDTVTIGKDHELGSLTTLCLADLFAPFFADENVPSANDSSRSMRPCWSSWRRSRPHAFSHVPSSVHFFRRRQQVAGDGKQAGKSFQGAPVRSIHRMPSTHGRDRTWGRPPCGPTGDCGKRSAIRFHCSSSSTNLGSIVDPVSDSTAPRDRFAISDLLSAALITAKTKRWFTLNSKF